MKRSLAKNRRLAKKRPRRLFLQQLEKRDLRAADIGFADGMLSVSGTANEDVVEAYTEDSQLIMNVSEYDSSGQLVDEQLRTFDADEVQQIMISTGDGDDVIVNDTDKRAVIRAGDGDDIVMAGDGGDIVSGGNGDDIVFGGAGRDVILGGAGNLTALVNSDVGDEQFPIEADLGLADIEPAESEVTSDLSDDDLVATDTEPDPLDIVESDPVDQGEAGGNRAVGELPSADSQEAEDTADDLNGSDADAPGDLMDEADSAQATSDGESLELVEKESSSTPIEEPMACEPAGIPEPQQSDLNQDEGPSSDLESDNESESNGESTADAEGSDDEAIPVEPVEPNDGTENSIPNAAGDSALNDDLTAAPEPEAANDEGSASDTETAEASDDEPVSSEDPFTTPEPEVAGDPNPSNDASADLDEPTSDESAVNEDDAGSALPAPTVGDPIGSDDPTAVTETEAISSAADPTANAEDDADSDNGADFDPTTAGVGSSDEVDASSDMTSADAPSGEEELPIGTLTDNDVIFGGSGNDWLLGGRGDDMIFGDGGIMTDDLLADILTSRLQDPSDLSA